jgi:UDP-N-acetylglucosamine 2-epimerase (hydrolysing)
MSPDRPPHKVLFVTGTRADFGKLKPLMRAMSIDPEFEVSIFVTGMHVLPKYGNTGDEIDKAGFRNTYRYINQKSNDSLDTILANTVQGLGNYMALVRPDLLIVHGDRVEALASTIVGALNNVRVAHIEGGEVSGTIDESIRHSISKLAHLHFVANDDARRRLRQMGERDENIHVIGSPDLDLMVSDELPTLASVKDHYQIPFDRYAILLYHPVTTSLLGLQDRVRQLLGAAVGSGHDFVAIYPNNDPGSELIVAELEALRGNRRFRIFPSVRFEAFLVLLRNAAFMLGNSSAAVREAPFYGIPAIDVGDRQNGRAQGEGIVHVLEDRERILEAIHRVQGLRPEPSATFGDGRSTERFLSIAKGAEMWRVDVQKHFVDR